MKTRIGIMGYGNLGRGVEIAVNAADDMELAAVFTRRAPETVKILRGEESSLRSRIRYMDLKTGEQYELALQNDDAQ